MKKIPQALLPLAAGLLLAVILSLSPPGKLLDHITHDLLMKYTSVVYTGPEVVVVGVDDVSLKAFKEPLLLWYGRLARVIEGISLGGADVAALDIIPAASLEYIAPRLDQQLVTSLVRARLRGTRIILGYSPDSAEKQPHRKFLLMSSGTGFVNLATDQDGKVRRQTLFLNNGNEASSRTIGLAAVQTGQTNEAALPERLYIDYRLSNLPVISFKWVHDQVVSENVQALQGSFKGKIVFVGAVSDILKDHFAVPYGQVAGYGRIAPGVLIHATTSRTLLAGKLLRDLDQALLFTVSMVIGVVSGLLLFLLPFRNGLFLLILILTVICVVVYAGFKLAVVIPFSLPFFSTVLPAVACFSWRAVLDHRKFSSLQRAFKSYVSPHVMKQIMENPGMVMAGGANTVATLMFTDIRGFTTLSETMPPELVLEGLNRYFTEMTAAVLEVNGYLNRYLGDGILAVFGAPNSLPGNGALAAVRCAVLMLQKLDQLNATGRIFKEMDVAVKIGIGIHTGEFIVGNVGCLDKMDYSVIGDAVNLASRIESLTKEYGIQVLISETVHALVHDIVETRYVGFTTVKGREQGIGIYEVLALKEGV